MTTDGIEKFEAMVITANCVAWGFLGPAFLDTCIVTSYALAAALTDLGYADARPVRVEAASFPDDCKLQAVNLGGSLGSPRRRARDGYWCGHLAVCIGQSWLLDPTLDQSNYYASGTQWADAGVRVWPVAAPLTPEFWDLDLPPRQRVVWARSRSPVATRYTLVPQKGFAWAPDARPSHWRPLAKQMTYGLEQTLEILRGGHIERDHSKLGVNNDPQKRPVPERRRQQHD